jgi:hypothetical protein
MKHFNDLDLPPEGNGDSLQEGVRRMIHANRLLHDEDAVMQLFEGFEHPTDEFALFCAVALRSRQFGTGIKLVPTDKH